MRGEADHAHHLTAPSQIFKPSYDPVKVEHNIPEVILLTLQDHMKDVSYQKH